MKDYTIGKEDKNEFILKYEIKDNDIIIEYASGEKYKTPYTREIEKNILEKMKNQILKTDVTKLKRNRINKLVLNFGLLNCLYLGMVGFLGLEVIKFILICLGLNALFVGVPFVKNTRKINDYYKNKCFVDNMKLFQDGIKENMGIYLNLDRKSKKFIDKTIKHNKELEENSIKEPSINTIDNISCDTVGIIYEMLMRNEEFSKYYSDEKENVKRKVLTPKK